MASLPGPVFVCEGVRRGTPPYAKNAGGVAGGGGRAGLKPAPTVAVPPRPGRIAVRPYDDNAGEVPAFAGTTGEALTPGPSPWGRGEFLSAQGRLLRRDQDWRGAMDGGGLLC